MAFILFTGFPSGVKGHVTLRNSGYVFIPGVYLHEIGAFSHQYAAIFLDEQIKKIAVQFSESKEIGYKKVIQEKTGVSLNVSAILRYMGLTAPKKRAHLKCSIEGKQLIIDLIA